MSLSKHIRLINLLGLLNLVTAIAFHGFENDDPHSHIRRFTKITQTFRLNNVPSDVVKLLLFLFSLEGVAGHGLKKNLQILSQLGMILYPTNGNFLTKNTQEALTIIENKSKVQASRNKTQVASASGSSTQDAHVTALTKKVEALLSSFNQPVNSIQNGCETCGGPHPYYECQAVGGYIQDVYATSRTYNQGDGPSVPPLPPFSSSKESPPALVSSEIPHPHPPTPFSFELPKRNPHEPPIPYPLRLNKEKLQDKLESCMALADLGRPFLRTARALVDVHGEELILRDGDEKLIFHADSTLKHPHNHGNESINMNNFIDITCEDRFPKVLKFKKLNHPFSGSTTSSSDSSPSLTPFETSDSFLEEFADELALFDPFPSRNEDDNFDPKADLREIEYLLNQDPLTESLPKSDIDIIIPFSRVKNKDSKMKLLNDEANTVELNVLLPQLLNSDSTLPEKSSESSEIATLSSSSFRYRDKDLILEDRNFLPIFSDQELLFHLELTVIDTLLSFSSENEDKVFNLGILTSKRVHSLTLELSHRTYETFKIVKFRSNNFNEGPMKIFPFLKEFEECQEIPSGEIKVHIELLSVLWGNRLLIPDGSLPLFR
nr:hypothetical protein [Tanacetum cinerariifolium]